MRALWSQLPRPRLGSLPSRSTTESNPAILLRRTTTTPLKRRATFNDAFTLLLAPFLAAAFIVDTSWKAKKRRDWDEKLSAIHEEIGQVKERETHVLRTLELRYLRHLPLDQRRGYSTASQAQDIANDDDYLDQLPWWSVQTFPSSLTHEVGSTTGPDALGKYGKDNDLGDFRQISREEMHQLLRYHRLNAIMLSVRMLLHLRTGPSPFFDLIPNEIDVESEDTVTSKGTAQLVELLTLTRKQIRPLTNHRALFMAAPLIEARASKGTLNQTIKDMTAEFDQGRISLSKVIHGFSNALMQSGEVPSVSTYLCLIRSLSRVHSYSLAYHVTAALKNSTLPLTDKALASIIFQIGQGCDSRSLLHILQIITRSEGRLNIVNPWEKAQVNGLEIPVPRSLNPLLLQALVHAALRCDQPERAEAWLTFLREADYGAKLKSYLFRSFLAYYARNGNWEKGQDWLQRSIRHASSMAAGSIEDLARVIFRMLDLCVRCQKLLDYTTILDAAVNAGIAAPTVDPNPNMRKRFYPRARSILLEWSSLLTPDAGTSSDAQGKARLFQDACQPLLHLGPQTTSQTGVRSEAATADLILMPATARNLRYTVRTPSHPHVPRSSENGFINDNHQNELLDLRYRKAKFANSDVRQGTGELEDQDTLAQAEKLQNTTRALQAALAKSKQALRQLQRQNRSYARDSCRLRADVVSLRHVATDLKYQHHQLDELVEDALPTRPTASESVEPSPNIITRKSHLPRQIFGSARTSRRPWTLSFDFESQCEGDGNAGAERMVRIRSHIGP